MKAIIPAAGMGTRFLPYTRSQPKEMLPIVDKPAIQYVVEEAIASGLHDILIVTARGKRAIEDHFDRDSEIEGASSGGTGTSPDPGIERILHTASIFYLRQTEHRGLGHAILVAEKFTDSRSFSVLLGDDLTFGDIPCQKSLIKLHSEVGASIVAVQDVPHELIGRYGMVLGTEQKEGVFRIDKIIEKPRPSEATSSLAALGRYVFTPAIFDRLRETPVDAKGEIQLTDAIALLLEREDVYAIRYHGRRYDIGDKLGWLLANIDLALKREELHDEMARALRDYSRLLR